MCVCVCVCVCVCAGVTTGIFTADQLRAAAPPGSEESGRLVILPDLTDTQAVLRIMGLA